MEVLVSRPLSRESQKHMDELVLATTNSLDLIPTTRRNHYYTTFNLPASKTQQ